MPPDASPAALAFLGNVGTGELLVVLVLALIVLGPDKLPETARKVGGFMRDMRRMSQGFKDEVRQAVDMKELDELRKDLTGGFDSPMSGGAGPSLPPLPEPDEGEARDQPPR